MTRRPAKLRNLALVAAGTSALAFASITAFSKAGGYPPLPKSALFQAVTSRNIEQVRNRINGSTNDRNQIPVGTVLVYKTSAGNEGKMQIVGYGPRFRMYDYDLHVKWVTYRPDGTVLSHGSDLLIKGTYVYDLDDGRPVDYRDRRADLWWEIVGGGQAYLDFKNGASFTIVS